MNKQLRFDGRVAVVTGAGRGLGRAYALQLSARGCRVVVNDPGVAIDGSALAEKPAEQVVREILQSGGEAVTNLHNVIDGAEAIVATALERYGRLDILINNAGIFEGGLFNEIPKQDWDRTIETHFGGTVAVSRAAWPHLTASGTGRIINISSNAIFGAPYASSYAAAKAGIFGLTRSLAGEGQAVGITVNTVMPNGFSRLTANVPDEAFSKFFQNYFPPAAVASFVAWLAHHETKINGETFSVGAGRASRVVLVAAAGMTVAEQTPEAWVGCEPKLLSLDAFSVPQSMKDELKFQMKNLGGPVAEDFAKIDMERNWKLGEVTAK